MAWIARSAGLRPRNTHTSPVRVISTASSREVGIAPYPIHMKLWKLLGIAGLAGVAASGVVVARNQRRRAAYTPDQIRERLHERLAEASRPE
ncbi:hypothetical protein Lesp01_51840 [Lentzea sp. NBRC 102530]|nr:hypothetical protein Lesp01_51840 [Lentzea sp. NBRC 102530]